MANTKTVHVPHLGGIDAGQVSILWVKFSTYKFSSYQMPHPYDPSKPTLILVNSFTTSSELYRSQYANKALTDKMNLLAIELLGHGKTRTKSENFTYWDSAIMNLQVMDALGIKKAFVLGTSQGGWITVRMALLGPDKIEGIIPLGTSMDYESERTRRLGCWDGIEACTGPINKWTTTQATPNFEPDTDYCNFLIDVGFGKNCNKSVRDFWTKTIKGNYQGDDGRRRARMAAINLRERDGLHGRLPDVRCPVLWLHGTDDLVYSVSNAQEEIKLFTNAKSANLVTVANGAHFLSASHPQEVDQALINFVGEWANKHV
jgi:pimeloyl-ACP methyl ester carboxylesterase